MWAAVFVAAAGIALAVRLSRRYIEAQWRCAGLRRGQRVLLVTAHPDDEAMFFAPAVRALCAAGLRVSLLCCSRGNADGLGDVRAAELARAATVLGIADTTVVEDPLLQDGLRSEWPEAALLSVMEKWCGDSKHAPDAVMSFDARGVSGHPNHTAVGAAARVLAHARRLPFLELVSAPLKYAGVLALVVEAALAAGRTRVASAVSRRRRSHDALSARLVAHTALAAMPAGEYGGRGLRAMAQHWSQMVWFRWLYVLFSRHMHVSVLRVHPPFPDKVE